MVNLSPHDFMSCKFYCRCTSSAHVQNVLEFDSIFPFLFCQLFAIVPIGAGAMGGKSLELAPWTWKGGRAVDPGLYTNVYDDLDTTPVRNSPTVQTVTLQTTNTGRADLFLYDFACICDIHAQAIRCPMQIQCPTLSCRDCVESCCFASGRMPRRWFNS